MIVYMKFAVIGLGYVGSPLAVMLSGHHDVFALDKNVERVTAIRERKSPIGNALMEQLLADNTALFAGGELSQEQKDAFFEAVMTAYLACKKEAKEKFGRKKQ